MSTTESSTHNPIILWSHPRAISSAFERAFIQRVDEFNCLHEPFCEAIFFDDPLCETVHFYEPQSDKTNLSNFDNELYIKDLKNKTVSRPHEQPLNESLKISFTKVLNQIFFKDQIQANNDANPKRVFVKEMAIYIKGHYGPNSDDFFSKDIMSKVNHTFLIRNPEKSVKSLYRTTQSLHNDATSPWQGYEFTPSDCGFSELVELFNYVKDDLKQTPIVVDADDLCHNSEKVLMKYCELVNITFEKSMLTWKVGNLKGWNRFKGWHSNAEQSTGFCKLAANTNDVDEIEYPSIVYETILKNKPLYEYMFQYKLKI